jgi:hypothetical protein
MVFGSTPNVTARELLGGILKLLDEHISGMTLSAYIAANGGRGSDERLSQAAVMTTKTILKAFVEKPEAYLLQTDLKVAIPLFAYEDILKRAAPSFWKSFETRVEQLFKACVGTSR